MKALPTLVAIACVLSSTPALSQVVPAPTVATDVTSAELQAALKRGQQDLQKPGTLTSDRLIGLADMGQYNVAVAMVTRAASAT